MRKTTTLILCAAAISGSAAAHGSNAGGGGHGWSGGTATGAATPSAHAVQNSNGIFAVERESGLNRADDRMSAQGLQHSQAMRAHAKRNGTAGTPSGSAADADGR